MAMRLHRFARPRDAAAAAAARVSTAIHREPRLVLGLPTGHTMIPLYAELRKNVVAGLDCTRLSTFNVDEFVGIAADHPGSFRQFLVRHLIAHLGLDPDRTYFLDGVAPDPEAECVAYEVAIRRAGGIDLQVLGIGTNGHIGFNEPGPVLTARTHRARLQTETRRANADWFDGDLSQVPHEALSMGMGTILAARRILLLATGGAKAAAVARAVAGPITTMVPASFLQLHRDVAVYLDEEAAAALPSAPAEVPL